MSFRVLFVCTGNICRSPAADLVFAREARGNDIASASAGTAGLTGRGVDKPTAAALREFGIDPARHVAQRLTVGLTNAADLVLTATTDHRATVVVSAPLAFRRTFTLREFGRLGADLGPLDGDPDPDSLRKRVADIADQRGWVDPAGPGEDDIGDPYGEGVEVAQACFDQIVTAVRDTVRALGLPVRD